MVNSVRSRLLVADVLKGLGKLNAHGLDTSEAKGFAQAALRAVQSGQLGYGVVIARKLSLCETRGPSWALYSVVRLH